MLVFTTVCSYFCSLRRHFGNTWQFWRADTTRLAGESNRQEGKKYRERRWETTGMTSGRREWGRGVWKRVWSVRRNTIFDKPICYLHAASLLFLWTTAYPDDTARDEGEVRTHAPQSSRSWWQARDRYTSGPLHEARNRYWWAILIMQEYTFICLFVCVVDHKSLRLRP